jgi:hypothetical protein
MSKSIWHTAAETPKAERYFIEHYKVVVGDKVYWKYGLFKVVSDDDYPFDQDTARWCYLDDLLALETELERTRKQLEIAVDALKEIDKTRCAVDANLYAANHKFLNAGNVFCWTTIDNIHNALEQIKELEQKDVK